MLDSLEEFETQFSNGNGIDEYLRSNNLSLNDKINIYDNPSKHVVRYSKYYIQFITLLVRNIVSNYYNDIKENKAKVNFILKNYYNFICYPYLDINNNYFTYSIYTKDEIIEILKNLDKKFYTDKITFCVIWKGGYMDMRELLTEKMHNINYQYSPEKTLLTCCLDYNKNGFGAENLIKKIIRLGGNINHIKNDRSLLYTAIIRKNLNIIRILIDNGAIIDDKCVDKIKKSNSEIRNYFKDIGVI